VIEAAIQRVNTLFDQYVKLCQSLNLDPIINTSAMSDPAKLSDKIAENLQLSIEKSRSCWTSSIPWSG